VIEYILNHFEAITVLICDEGIPLNLRTFRSNISNFFFKNQIDADDMSQDLDDEEDWELEDDEDEDIVNEDPTRQLDVDICPPNLDQKLYDDVVALREKRLDLGITSTAFFFFLNPLFLFAEEAITDEKTVLQSLQQTLGQTQIYSNKIDAELKSKQADLIDFQVK
jgi:hypothetical protein